MSETLFAVANQQLAEHLLAIRKSGAWRSFASSFDVYVTQRWSLSKSRAKLLCDFAKFCAMARTEYLPVPDSPDNIKPILRLPHKHWMDVWRLCRDYATGPVNAKHCQATMEHFGVFADKKLPSRVLNGRRVRRAARTMAEFQDGEKLVEQIGPDGLGKDWNDAVRVTIDADQARLNSGRGK